MGESVLSKPFFVNLSMNDDMPLRDVTTVSEMGKLFHERKSEIEALFLLVSIVAHRRHHCRFDSVTHGSS